VCVFPCACSFDCMPDLVTAGMWSPQSAWRQCQALSMTSVEEFELDVSPRVCMAACFHRRVEQHADGLLALTRLFWLHTTEHCTVLHAGPAVLINWCSQ